MNPVLINLNRPVSLLQEDDIRNNVRSGIGTESIVGQSDCAEKIRTLSDILTGAAVLGIHCIAGGHKGHYAARTHLIERLCKKVVVDGKTELVVSPVVHLILSKGHVADSQIIEVFAVSRFKTGHCDIGLWIELLGNSPGDTVQLHTVEL